jgi:quercetin dioxygenase-like cupin family protein
VDLAQVPAVSAEDPVRYEQSVGTKEFRGGHYVLRAGASDPQEPHTEDEAYLVLAGSAILETGGERHAVRAGHAILVPAGVPHRFVDIDRDLTLFVLFARVPPDGPQHRNEARQRPFRLQP